MKTPDKRRRATVSGTEHEGSTAVDAYLARRPASVRVALEKLRKVIRSAAPQATEVIGYQMPTFRHFGALVCFGAHANHCSFYLMDHAAMAAHRPFLRGYDTSGVTIRFTPDKPLPASLVKRIVEYRLRQNAEAHTRKART